MENHARFFDVIWAALRSGWYLTTINRYLTNDEAAHILDNCNAKALVASRYLADIGNGLPATSTLWNFGADTVYLSPAPMYHSAPLVFRRVRKRSAAPS